MGISRRRLIESGISAVAASQLGRLSLGEASKRPNIVWIVCHDVHAPLIGCYGNQLAKTPTIDGLARQGVMYRNAFSTTPVCAPSRFALVTGTHAQTCAPSQHMRADGVLPSALKPLPLHMRAAGYYCTNNVFTDYNFQGDQEGIWDDCDIKAHWRNRPAGKPFFSVYNYLITHEMFVFGHEPTKTDPASVRVPKFLPDKPEIRQVLARNIDIVNKQDAAVDHLLGELEADGLADNTIVFFLADHGGVHPRSKRYCYDDGLHVPLIVRLPRSYGHLARSPIGQETDEVVSLVDMAPTMLALAGLPKPSTMPGQPFLGDRKPEPRRFAFSMRDRMDERYDLVYTVRSKQYRYLRNYMPQRIYGQHEAYEWQSEAYQAWERAHIAGELDGIQQKFWQTKQSEELYDVAADPDEIKNLVNDPNHHSQLTELRSALDAFMISIHDNGFIPEGAAAEGYNASRVPGAYPLKEVMKVAMLTNARDPKNVPAFVHGLNHPNDIVRYWHVQGLVLSGPLSADVLSSIQRRLTEEKQSYIQCALAEALITSGKSEVVRNLLITIAQDDSNERLQLRALNILTLMPDDQLILCHDAIARLSADKDELVHRLSQYLLLRVDGKYDPNIKIVKGPDAKINQKKRIGDPDV